MSTDLPENWTEMEGVEQSEIMVFKNWNYELFGYQNQIQVGGATGSTASAMFDFVVRPYVSGQNSAEVDEDEKWSISFTYQIEHISGAGRGFDHTNKPSQREFIKEMLMLSYAVTLTSGDVGGPRGRLPRRNESVFGITTTGEGAVTIQHEPVVDTISLNQAGQDPNVWHMQFRAKKLKFGDWVTTKPEPKEVPSDQKPVDPWDMGASVTASYSTQPYVLGAGYNHGLKTPSQVQAALDGGTGGSLFTTSGAEFEIVQNKAGDPFRSPPPMNTVVLTLNIERNFRLAHEFTASTITNAMGKINAGDITITSAGVGHIIKSGNGMLTGFAVTPATYDKQVDWLPKQEHPFGKSYTELGWASGKESNNGNTAVNHWDKVLRVTNTIKYKKVSMTVTVKTSGWGTFIPNKGYRKKVGTKHISFREEDKTKHEEQFLNDTGTDSVEAAAAKLIAYCPFKADGSLSSALALLIPSTT